MSSKNLGNVFSFQSLTFPKEGEIWLVKFEKLKEFSKPYRPCLVVSNNFQNEFDDKIIVVPTTTEDIEDIQPFEVFINNKPKTGLTFPSKLLCNYPHTIYKKLRLVDKKPIGVAKKAVLEIVEKYNGYLNNSISITIKRKGGEEEIPVPFIQILDALTGSGKTVILAKTVGEISKLPPLKPIIL
ncbi:16959_t:CDS:2 [Gigaspora margarita]|uniref:16959_t:CDS:1 n=1 Tax=Gigaspora margarita TaxID=4874 RepID=A0ABM8VW43_GIGMA|nr:16959_t:CDS:2 [Gigaspora margarita]